MENRHPGAPREDRGAGGEGDAAAEEVRGQRAGIDVAVHEERQDLAAPERFDERREAVLERGDPDPRAFLERAHLAGQEGVDLHPRHRVHPEPEPRQSDADDLPVAQVRHREDGAPSPRDRAVQELGARDPEGGAGRQREGRGAAQIFHPAPMVGLEHAPRRAPARLRVGEARVSAGGDPRQVLQDGGAAAGAQAILERGERPRERALGEWRQCRRGRLDGVEN